MAEANPPKPRVTLASAVPGARRPEDEGEELNGRFSPAATAERRREAAAPARPGAAPQPGMDLLTFYLMMTADDNSAATPGSPDSGDNEREESLAQDFARFVSENGLRDETIVVDGQTMTMGQLADRMIAAEGLSNADAGQALNMAALPEGSPITAGAVRRLETMAQQHGVLGSIQRAAQVVGADYTYLLTTAYRESGFDHDVRARTSSATGLFQFLDGTWLTMVSRNRALLESQGIDVPESRSAILALRTNPYANALMGAAFARDNERFLESRIGGGFQADSGDLYLAHFLGAGGAVRAISAARSGSDATMRDLFPEGAGANSSVAGRTMQQMLVWADQKMAPTFS